MESESTQRNRGWFKKGIHWRPRKPYWEKWWLVWEYEYKQRSAADIAKQFGIGDTAIHYWLKRLGIKTRTVSEARKVKHWGLSGISNPMFGRFGKENPNWNGGHSPERQSVYARATWKELARSILNRDGYKCKKCGVTHVKKVRLVVHHIRPWAKYPELRFVAENLITVCEICHKKIHKKKII